MKTTKTKKGAKQSEGRRVDMNGKDPTSTVIGAVPIVRTDGLYFTIDGGTFTSGDNIKGSFAACAGGGAMIVYLDEDGQHESYEVRTEDIIKAILAYRITEAAAKVSTTEEKRGEGERG